MVQAVGDFHSPDTDTGDQFTVPGDSFQNIGQQCGQQDVSCQFYHGCKSVHDSGIYDFHVYLRSGCVFVFSEIEETEVFFSLEICTLPISKGGR